MSTRVNCPHLSRPCLVSLCTWTSDLLAKAAKPYLPFQGIWLAASQSRFSCDHTLLPNLGTQADFISLRPTLSGREETSVPPREGATASPGRRGLPSPARLGSGQPQQTGSGRSSNAFEGEGRRLSVLEARSDAGREEPFSSVPALLTGPHVETGGWLRENLPPSLLLRRQQGREWRGRPRRRFRGPSTPRLC